MAKNRELRVFGGARLGLGWNWTWPFASLRADDAGLGVRTPGRRYALSRSDIRGLKIGRVLFSMGLEIVHDRDDVPSPLIFWTRDAAHLEENLGALNFSVSREKLSVTL